VYVLCARYANDRLGCADCQDELFASLRCQPNFPCTRAELSEDLKTLLGYVLLSMQDSLYNIDYASHQHDAWRDGSMHSQEYEHAAAISWHCSHLSLLHCCAVAQTVSGGLLSQ